MILKVIVALSNLLALAQRTINNRHTATATGNGAGAQQRGNLRLTASPCDG